jgi:hypothetical protein
MFVKPDAECLSFHISPTLNYVKDNLLYFAGLNTLYIYRFWNVSICFEVWHEYKTTAYLVCPSSIAQKDGTRRHNCGAQDSDKSNALYTSVSFTYINFRENLYTVRSCISSPEVDFDEVQWYSDHESIIISELTALQWPHTSCKLRSRYRHGPRKHTKRYDLHCRASGEWQSGL